MILRTDTRDLALISVFFNYSGTSVAKILYYTSYERYLFSLSNDVVIRRFRFQNIKDEHLKEILSLLFVEQGFLDNHAIVRLRLSWDF